MEYSTKEILTVKFAIYMTQYFLSETKVKDCVNIYSKNDDQFWLEYTNPLRFLTSMELYVKSLALHQEMILQRRDVANNFNTFCLIIRCGSVCGRKRANIGMSSVKFLFLSLANDEGLTLETLASLSLPGGNLTLINLVETIEKVNQHQPFIISLLIPLPGAFLAYFYAPINVKWEGGEAGHKRGI